MARSHVPVTGFFLIAIAFLLQQCPCSQGLPYDVVKKMWDSQKIPVTAVLNGEISPDCLSAALNATVNATRTALDAYGKRPAGVFVGNLAWIGHFDECNEIPDFQYCLLDFNITEPVDHLQENNVVSMQYGMCLPNKCTPEDVRNGFQMFVHSIPGFDFKDRLLIQHEPWCTAYGTQYSAGFFIAVVSLGLLFLVVVSSSIYFSCQEAQGLYARDSSVNTQTNHPGHDTSIASSDTSHLICATTSTAITISTGRPSSTRQSSARGDSKLDRVIHSFALPRNIPILLSGNTPNETISCLNGMRVISLLWVILAHTFSFIGTFSEPYNRNTGHSWFYRFMFPIISNPHSSVDSFFFFSGLLVTFLTLKQMRKTEGKIRWVWFYLHRYWRLAPPLAVTMVFYTLITPYFGEGPFAQMLSVRQNCPKYWWTNLLFINNFYPANIGNECMPWVWYLANVMQFFVISPLILIPLYFIPKVGILLLSCLLASSVLTTTILAAVFEFQAIPGLETNGRYSYWDMVYTKPYCRIQPYLIGILVGYMFHRVPKDSVKMNACVGFLGWTVMGALGGAVVSTVPTPYTGSDWPPVVNIIYLSVSRIIWTLYVAWVASVCHYGHGGWVNAVLSHNIWAPLARLGYSTYLVHPILIKLYLSSLGTPPYLSLQLMSFTYAGICLISYVCAAILLLMVEYPLRNLEKLFFPQP